MIKISGISHNRGKKSFIKIAWMVFQNIYHMYHYINNKEQINYAIIIIRMSEHEQANKVKNKLKPHRITLKTINLY